MDMDYKMDHVQNVKDKLGLKIMFPLVSLVELHALLVKMKILGIYLQIKF